MGNQPTEESAVENHPALTAKIEQLLAEIPEPPPALERVRRYLESIAVCPPLTTEEEQQVWWQIEQGVRARAMLTGELNADERTTRQQQIELAERARRRLIAGNLWFVVSIARRYIGRGLSFAELLQQGNVGLVHAFEHRPDGPNRLSPLDFYKQASWWIRQRISQEIATQERETFNFVTARFHLHKELGRTPTVEEITLEMGILEVEDGVRVLQAQQRGEALEAELASRWAAAVAKVERLLQGLSWSGDPDFIQLGPRRG